MIKLASIQSIGTIKCNISFWVLCFLLALTFPTISFSFNHFNTDNNYYHNAEWVPTYISKQYSGIVCINEVQLSLDETGKVRLRASLLMSTQPVIDANYKVQVVGKNTDTVTCQDVGYKIKALVTEISSGNSCWSFVLVEDKLKPNVKCRDTTVLCTGTQTDLDSIPGILTISDNCTPNQFLKISHADNVNFLDCSNDTFSMVTRNWSAIDPWGRVGTCTQKISLLRPKLSDIVFPKDTTIYCPASNLSPSVTGTPSVKGKALDKFCGWNASYVDNIYSKCGNSKKILRTWNILNFCMIKDTSATQFIVFSDTTRPVIICKALDSVSTSPDQCEAEYLLKPVLSATDACTTIGMTTLIRIDHTYYGLPNTKTILSIGVHWLDYEVSDACGNKSTCYSTLIVKDKQKPFLLCPDTVQISLPALNVHIAVKDISSVSGFDNCGIYSYTFRRTIDNCLDGVDDTKFKDTVSVCCSDVFKQFDFVFLAIDTYGNKDSCHVKVNVVDKSAPQLNCHLDTTINCNQTKPILLNPRLALVDNCADSVKIKIDTLINAFNICGIGQFKRRITAIDPGNNKDTCYQTITVVNIDTLKPEHISILDTVKVVGCADSLRNNGNPGYQKPIIEFDFLGCHKLSISYTDTFQPTAGTSRCRIVKRTWRIGDSCQSLSTIKVLKQIIIQDTTSFSPVMGPIQGNINSITGVPIEKVHVEGRNESNAAIFTQMTTKEGQFNWSNPQHLVSLSLLKDESNSLNGISTLDLLKIQRHIAGTRILTDPLDLFAADINGDGEINVVDLLQLRKYLLGFDDISNHLPWKFIRDNSTSNTIHPGMILTNEFMVNTVPNFIDRFIGFRVGDLNHDASYNELNSLETRATQTVFQMESTPAGMSISPLQSIDAKGLQFSFINNSGWSGIEIESPIKGLHYSINQTELRINFEENEQKLVKAGSAIFVLKGLHDSQTILPGRLKSEWYDQSDGVHPIQFSYAKAMQNSIVGLKLFPNPVGEYLNIEFQEPTELLGWKVIDEMGRVLLHGANQPLGKLMKLDLSTLPSGLFIVQMQQVNGIWNNQRFVKVQ